MNSPPVSVVMVVCNVDRFLAESIESILAQSFREFEFIIVDFGSTDKSRAIISEYKAKDERIKFKTIPHCGLAEARNASCSFARGRYVAIMDADDVSVPQRLAWQVEFLEQHPEVGVLGGAAEWIDKNGRALVTFGNPVRDREIRAALLEYCPLWQPSVLMRREAFVDVGGYRPPFAPAEDYDLWLRMSEHFQLGNLKQVVLKYRIHPHQVSIRKQRQQTFGRLAALASASLRKNGMLDPFDRIEAITPVELAGLGVTEARQQREFVSESRKWIRHMCMAGEYTAALDATLEMLQSDLQYIERWQIADLHLTAARLYRIQRRFARSIIAAGRAVVTRPILLGRPVKSWLGRIGMV
jgi:GT2 family glycosyltransferase